MNSELVIDVSPSEITIALLEDKKLVELNKEKSNQRFSVGDIYLARVKKTMPGMNAAFVDVGYERDAFLHYLDLGPQFMTLHKYLQHMMKDPKNTLSVDKFKNLPDIDKHGKIVNVLRPGQYVLVQIAKEPISTKGPRITSEISIPGRNLVLIPFSNKISVSQKIKSTEERERLRNLMTSIKPKNYGVIIRTVAKNRRVATLDTELRELIEKWESSLKSLAKSTPPQLVLGELNKTTAILRDILNSNFNSISVNNNAMYNEIKDYINHIAPEKQKIVKLVDPKTPIFEKLGVSKQIKSLFGKTVTFKNGAYLIIEHTEALHVIDVNSGNRTKKESDQESNALEVNMAAADEIARHLRLRDMGGIIVVDFIDMGSNEHRQQLFDRMKGEMSSDPSKHNILPLSKFGLMQITRQRTRPETNIENTETCPVCQGSGEITPSVLLIDEIESNIRYLQNKKRTPFLLLKVHPYILAYLTKGLFSLKLKWMWKYKMRLSIQKDSSFTFLEYHFFDNNGDRYRM